MTEGDSSATLILDIDGDGEADVKVQKHTVWISPKYCAYLAAVLATLATAYGVLQ